tara:strand:+ start:122 stop:709 length:588 start_codon:yes stop_codon:yes gene_type:complete
MFNGIILHTGKVHSLKRNKNSILVGIQSNLKLKSKDLGTSICCDGVCLTLEKIKSNILYFYISNETIRRSNFKKLKIGQKINLEKSLIFGQEIAGNFIQGHVDTIAKVKEIQFIDKAWILRLELQDKDLRKFLEQKASISVNGVSLTISSVTKKYFELNIIPHTLKLTNLKNLKKNEFVNVELDIFGKYIYKFSI